MADLHTRESAYASTRQRNLILAVVFGAVCIITWLMWMKDIVCRTAFDYPIQVKFIQMVVFGVM